MSRSEVAFDAALLAAVRGGADRVAAEHFDRVFRADLTRFCLGYLGRQQDAEDAVQDVFAKAIASDVEPASVRTWLLRIARNHCLNVLRGGVRRRDREPLPSSSRFAPAAAVTGFLTRLVEGERLAKVERAFAELSANEREALRLRYGEDLSRAEIAAITGVAESVVKSRLFEGLRKLRTQLG